MGSLLLALGLSMVILAVFSVLVYGAPLAGALTGIGGSLVMIAVLLGHLWARERREARS